MPQQNQTPLASHYNSSTSTQSTAAVTPAKTLHKEPPAPLVPYGPTPPKPLNRPSFIVPPADVQIIIDKMASYVAKNGRDFESIVKSKGDPRFNFLELSHQYHGYYAHKLTIYEGDVNPRVLTEEELLQKQELQEEKQKKLEELQKKQQRMEEVQKRVKMIQEKKKGEASAKKQITTVSFSIKKPKEGEASVIEKRNALPQEESDDENDVENKEEANHKSESPTSRSEEKLEKSPSPKIEREQKKKTPDRSATNEKRRQTPTRNLSTVEKSSEVINEKKMPSKRANFSLKPPTVIEKSSALPEKSTRLSSIPDVTAIVDLTDDLFDDCELIPTKQTNEERIMDKMMASAREKLNATRERQLQMERRKKAAMFLSQIQAPQKGKLSLTKSESRQLAPSLLHEDPVISILSNSPDREELEIEELRICTNSLMNKLRGSEKRRKRSTPKSRSRSKSSSSSISSSSSSSSDSSDRHKSHKKRKKKKSSHKR